MNKITVIVNDVEIHWDERTNRVAKPCQRCEKPTRGRIWGVGGLKRPSCMTCAIQTGIDKIERIYGAQEPTQ